MTPPRDLGRCGSGAGESDHDVGDAYRWSARRRSRESRSRAASCRLTHRVRSAPHGPAAQTWYPVAAGSSVPNTRGAVRGVGGMRTP